MKQSETKEGKLVAVVTGASGGFGLLTTLELAKQNYYVIAAMRDLSKGELLMKRAAQLGLVLQIECLALDVTDHEAIRNTIAYIIEKHGRIDLLINNAGVAIGGMIEEIPMEDWSRQMEVNFFGLVEMTRAVLPHMRMQRQGKIINMSSISGRFGSPGYGPYSASKFAVEGFSEALRMEMLPFGVRVVLVEPGAYRTEIWSKGFEHISLRSQENSPYSRSFNAILQYARNAAQNADDPQKIAKLIVRIARSRSPKLRYTIGKGARLSIFARTILPWKWLERILWRELNK